MTGSRDRVPPVSPGEYVRQYEIIDEIGRGGMGVVFRARDTTLGRQVAIKCPWPDLAENPDHRGRFLREVKVESRLSHPNIVPLFEAFEDLGVPWLVMQHISGQSLRSKLVQDGKLQVGRVLRYGEELVSALQHAHESGVLHRDINPQNIIVSREDRCYLTDFGLAKFVHTSPAGESTVSTDTEPMTSRGVVMGTPHYMAPEQTLGHELDERSDVFSMGLVFYEMCTGQQAFNGSERGALFDAILHREPDPIKRYTYEIPDELEAVVRKCINKRPDERYQSAREIGADLRRLRRTSIAREVTETDPSFIPQAKKPSWWGYVLPALAAIAITATLAWFFLRPEAGSPVRSPVQLTSSEAWESDPVVSPDGTHVAFTSDAAGNLDIYLMDIRGGTPVAVTSSPEDEYEACWIPDGSGLLFVSKRGGEPSVWKTGPLGGNASLVLAGAESPAVSPNGVWLAFTRPDSTGRTRVGKTRLDGTGESVFLTGDNDGLWDHRSPAWSPDGNSLCYAAQQDLWIVPADGGGAGRLTTDGGVHLNPCWSPEGDRVYYASYRDATLAIWSIEPGADEPVRLTLGTGPEDNPHVAGDGSMLAYSTNLGTHDIVIADLRTGREERLPGMGEDLTPTLSPSGDRVVFASNSRGDRFELWVLDLENNRPTSNPKVLVNQAGNASHPVFSPDGRWIAYYRILDDQRDLWLVSSDGGVPRRLTEHPAPDIHPAWSPDGSSLAFSSDREDGARIWIMDLENGQRAGEPRRVPSGPGTYLAPVWSPDGTRIACVGSEGNSAGEVWILDPAGEAAPELVTRNAQVQRVYWDARGLWASARWDAAMLSIRRRDHDTSGFKDPEMPLVFGDTVVGTFDVSDDGNVVVFSKANFRGDIWTFQEKPGTF